MTAETKAKLRLELERLAQSDDLRVQQQLAALRVRHPGLFATKIEIPLQAV